MLHWWTSENSRIALRAKQFVSWVVPESLLVAMKKRYYFHLLKRFEEQSGENEMLALPLIVRKGDFVVDIGSNIGTYTKKLSSLVGAEGLVWSIEPVGQTFDVLSYLIRKNGWSNVEAFNVALSDSSGTVEMEIPRWKGGGEKWYDARIFSPETRHPDWRTVPVRMVTLDSLTEKLERPISFIKCDAEFHELACLHGAKQTIAKWHPAWLIEMLDDYYKKTSDAENIAQFLDAFGYKGYLFDSKGFRVRKPDEKSQNAFFFCSAAKKGCE
jgi:FkbM family methyltransferase